MKKLTTLFCAALMAVLPAMAQTYSKDLEKKAKGGDAEAMIEVGDCYFKGAGVEKNAKKAKEWYEKAIKAGNTDAYTNIVACYQSWDGIEKNPKKAFKWIERGAKAGNADMQLALAKAYESGEGTARNPGAATNEYIKAAYTGTVDAFEPAIKGALAANNDVDAFALAYMALQNSSHFTDEQNNFFKSAQGLVMLHAGYDAAANHFFGDNNDPQLVSAKLHAKLKGSGIFDAAAWNELVSTMPDDDAEANFIRGVLATNDGQWPQAADYFSKSAQAGNADARLALYILAQSSGTCSTLAEHETYFNDSPLISVVLAKMSSVRHEDNPQLLNNSGLETMKDLDFDSVKRRVEAHNNDPLNNKQNLNEELKKYIDDKYFEGMEHEGDARGILLKYTKRYGYTLYFLIGERQFIFDLQRAAAKGVPMAATLGQEFLNVYNSKMSSRPTPSEQDRYNTAKAQIEQIKALVQPNSISSINDFIPTAYQAAYSYNETKDEQEKAKYARRYAAWLDLIKNWMNPVPDKLNFILMCGDDNMKKEVFTEAATKFPRFVLEWAEGTGYSTEVIAGDLSLPELLELAAKNATGDTKAKIVRALKTRYGRTVQ